MRDPEIRHALVRSLRLAHPDPRENRIWNEMPVGLCASRVDVGLVNGKLSGFEIKSRHDNLDRLPGQIGHYGRCLDMATLITSPERMDRVLELVPEWWGVIAAEGDSAGVVLSDVRSGCQNPARDPFAIAQLLWRDEAYAELESRGLHDGLKRATRWVLWDRLAELDMDDLSEAVRWRLKARPVDASSEESV